MTSDWQSTAKDFIVTLFGGGGLIALFTAWNERRKQKRDADSAFNASVESRVTWLMTEQSQMRREWEVKEAALREEARVRDEKIAALKQEANDRDVRHTLEIGTWQREMFEKEIELQQRAVMFAEKELAFQRRETEREEKIKTLQEENVTLRRRVDELSQIVERRLVHVGDST